MSSAHQAEALDGEEVSSSLRLRSLGQTSAHKAVRDKLSTIGNTVCLSCGKVDAIKDASLCDREDCRHGL